MLAILQLKFSDGTVEELTVPWVERYSRVTSLMAAFVIKLLEAWRTPESAVDDSQLSPHKNRQARVIIALHTNVRCL